MKAMVRAQGTSSTYQYDSWNKKERYIYMNDKQKIRAEVKRLWEYYYNIDINAEALHALDKVKDFIDSMPKFKVGQTIKDPTDSAFTFHINKIEDGKYIESDEAWVLIPEADKEYQLVEEPVSKDLENEIAFLSERYPEVSFAKLSRIAVYIANWQKQQMMKDANTYIVERHYDKYVGKYLTPDVTLNEQVYKVGDLVKIIIIKED